MALHAQLRSATLSSRLRGSAPSRSRLLCACATTPPPQEACDLLAYLNASPTPFHAVAESAARLRAAGFAELSEREAWSLSPGGRYYFTRNASTLVAFALGRKVQPGSRFVVVGAHTDSPCLKLKPINKALPRSGFLTLGVEPYGGGLWYSWFDRDLSLAGRCLVRGPEGALAHRLVRIARPVLRIPSLAIHLNREVNTEGFKVNAQQHLPSILASSVKSALASRAPAPEEGPGAPRSHPLLQTLLSAELGCAPDDIADFELQVVDTQAATLGGAYDEFIYSGRLDNLTSCYTSLAALLASSSDDSLAEEGAVRVLAHFDHEEVGSQSAAGAGSTVMLETVRRIATQLGRGEEGVVERSLRASFLVSADMAHGVHPNYSDKHDAAHAPAMHGGLTIKHNANQRYATDGVTAFIFRELGKRVGVPVQEFTIRSDLACGSTIGPIIAASTGMRCVDVGAPMLSMHSIREMCATDDVGYAIRHFSAVYERFSTIDIAVDG